MNVPNNKATYKCWRQNTKQSVLKNSKSNFVLPSCTIKKKKTLRNLSKFQCQDHGSIQQSVSNSLNANKFYVLQVNEIDEGDDANLEENVLLKYTRGKKVKRKYSWNKQPKKTAIVKWPTCTLPKEDPIVLRCRGCFQSHFPNAKFCRRGK